MKLIQVTRSDFERPWLGRVELETTAQVEGFGCNVVLGDTNMELLEPL